MAQKTWASTVSTGDDWSNAANWDSTGVPGAGDDVRLPAGGVGVVAGLDQSAVALGDVIVEKGFTGNLGSTAEDLKLNCGRFEYAGTGQAYVDLSASTLTLAIEIQETGSAGDGENSLNLIPSTGDTVSIESGDVGIAAIHQDTANIAALRIVGEDADVDVGEGVTVGQVDMLAGECLLRGGSSDTTVNVHGGELKTQEESALGTVTVRGGTFIGNSRGTIENLVCDGGESDFTQSGSTRSVVSIKLNPGASLLYDPASLGWSSWATPDEPIRLTGSEL